MWKPIKKPLNPGYTFWLSVASSSIHVLWLGQNPKNTSCHYKDTYTIWRNQLANIRFKHWWVHKTFLCLLVCRWTCRTQQGGAQCISRPRTGTKTLLGYWSSRARRSRWRTGGVSGLCTSLPGRATPKWWGPSLHWRILCVVNCDRVLWIQVRQTLDAERNLLWAQAVLVSCSSFFSLQHGKLGQVEKIIHNAQESSHWLPKTAKCVHQR